MTTHVITPIGPAFDLRHLEECCQSVADQYPSAGETKHHLVADFPEFRDQTKSAELTSLALEYDAHLTFLPAPTANIGSTPRTVGTAIAWGLGADAVAFLDADCAYSPDHLERLHRFARASGQPIVASGRYIIPADSIPPHDARRKCPEIQPGKDFHDTNTFLFTRHPVAVALSYTFGTLFDREEHLVGDRHLTARCLDTGLFACHYHPTVFYRSAHRFHYHTFGWQVPDALPLKSIADELQHLATTHPDRP